MQARSDVTDFVRLSCEFSSLCRVERYDAWILRFQTLVSSYEDTLGGGRWNLNGGTMRTMIFLVPGECVSSSIVPLCHGKMNQYPKTKMQIERLTNLQDQPFTHG